MAEKTAGDSVDIDLGKIIAAGLGHGQALSDEELQEFDALLDAPHLSDAQRQEFLQAVWNVIVACIDYGWGDHPVQQAFEACGKPKKSSPHSGIPAQNLVKSKAHHLSHKYNKAAE